MTAVWAWMSDDTVIAWVSGISIVLNLVAFVATTSRRQP